MIVKTYRGRDARLAAGTPAPLHKKLILVLLGVLVAGSAPRAQDQPTPPRPSALPAEDAATAQRAEAERKALARAVAARTNVLGLPVTTNVGVPPPQALPYDPSGRPPPYPPGG